MRAKFTAQDVDDQVNPVGELQVRYLTDQGEVATMNHIFAPYCLPHTLMEASKSNAFENPDTGCCIRHRARQGTQQPSNIGISDKNRALLDVAFVRCICFLWKTGPAGEPGPVQEATDPRHLGRHLRPAPTSRTHHRSAHYSRH